MNKTLILLALFSTTTLAADPILLSAVSRKTHGTQTFDIELSPNDGYTEPLGVIEPRAGPNHRIVFTFDRPITEAECWGYRAGPAYGAAVIAGNEVTCPVYAPVNTWAGVEVVVTDSIGWAVWDVKVGYLLGDVNGSGAVTVSDYARVRQVIAQPLTQQTFRYDVNASGAITVSDAAIVQSRIATGLPRE